jgi:hypothetical protein
MDEDAVSWGGPDIKPCTLRYQDVEAFEIIRHVGGEEISEFIRIRTKSAAVVSIPQSCAGNVEAARNALLGKLKFLGVQVNTRFQKWEREEF